MNTRTIISLFLALLLSAHAALLAVDYGQEYTKAVLIAPSVPLDVILSSDSKRKDIAGVSFGTDTNGDLTRHYGFHALNSCIKKPAGCFVYSKPLLGMPVNGSASSDFVVGHPGVKLTESAGRNGVSFQLARKSFSVEEVIAMNLADIKQRAEDKWNELSSSSYNVIDQIVLTVPRFFNQSQRHALIDAAEIAGMKVVGLVDDGSCIATSYAEHRTFDEGAKKYHIIYDMGAGSTKATLASFTNVNGTVTTQVEGYGYDATLGGHRFTQVIREILVDQFVKDNKAVTKQDLISDYRAMNKLWQAANKAKLVLSANAEAHVSVEVLHADKDLKCAITRKQFEAKAAHLLARVAEPLKKCIGGDLKKVESVILAGGSTRIPVVQQVLSEVVGNDTRLAKNVNADEAPVFGLTMRGAGIAGYRRRKNVNLVETSQSDISYNLGGKDQKLISIGEAYDEGEFTVPLDLVNKPYTITLAENGRPYQGYEIEQLPTNKTADKYTGEFSISRGGLARLKSVKASYKDQTKTLHIKSHHIDVKPLSKRDLKESISKLAILDRQDKDRIKRENLLNSLESAAYDMRSYVTEDEVVKQGPKKLVAECKKLANKLLEWLDEDSFHSKTKEIKKKLDTILHHRKKLDLYVKTPDGELTLAKFSQASNSSTTMLNKLQNFMVTMSGDALKMREQFDKYKLDFEAANKNLQFEMKDKTEKELQEVTKQVKEFSDLVSQLEETPEELQKRTHVELVDLKQGAKKMMKKLKKIMNTLETVHDVRMAMLKEQLRSAKRELKKASEESSSTKGSSSTESSSTESVSTESSSEISSETKAQGDSKETTTVQSHDEL